MNARETPGIISLITEEEIKNSGARDLIDVLRLIPGIDFGVDVEGVVGLGMRGNWANEGKILILLDGQETNEIMFASSQLGNRFPIDLIKRIEIIRGPGSAIYGGYAEYGVVNIITKQAEDINGIFASATYGQMQKDYGRKNISLALGKKINDFSFNLSGFIGRAQRSDQIYKDFNGNEYDMRGNSDLITNYLNFGAKYKTISFKLILDDYKIKTKGGYGNVITNGITEDHFENIYTELKYDGNLSKNWKLSSRLNYKSQQPWENLGYEGTSPYNKHASRSSGNLTASYEPNRNLNIVFGTEAYYDQADDYTEGSVFKNSKNHINYFNYSFFAQSLLKTRFVNLTAGARFDRHSAFGNAFVPRLGLTKKLNKFHYKILFGRSFRAPSIENINSADSSGIKPEFTNVTEIELGYQISKNSIFSFNVFDITTTKPIVYYTSIDSTNSDFYTNFGSSGTQGIEAEYKYKSRWGYVTLNYAYYTALNKTRISSYETKDPSALLAFANHRINLSTNVNFNQYFSGNLTASFYGNRWNVSGYDTSGFSIFEKSDPFLLVNCFLQVRIPKIGMNVGIGAYDILNQRYQFIQPYDGGHAPLPGPSREFILRLQYNLNFKNKS
jgi:outer membrane receptor for ferrienterochelin and colicin